MPQTLSLKIGPSGVRGVVGESLTPQLVTSFAAAFGTYCGAGPILIGTDTRASADMLKQAAIAGLLSVGCTPVDLGIVPVPSLMLHVRTSGAFGGIMISGGHGSAEWNALRFISAEGLALRANQAAELTDLYHQGSFPRVRASEMSEVRSDASAVARHVQAIAAGADAARVRAGRLKVAVDAKGGAAARAVVDMLETFGCAVAAVDPAAGGWARPDELDVTDVGGLVRSSGADLGVAIDADGDRLALTDERGDALGPDGPVVLAVQYWLERHAGPVVVNVAATRAVDDVVAKAGARVVRCRVGEASLVESMIEHGADIGGEGDGGVVARTLNPCRDSLATLALVLEAVAASGQTISALRARAPRYASARERLLCSAREIAPSLRLISHAFRGEQFDLTDGVKVVWPDRWLLARPAATEPVIRLSAEAPTDAEARALITGIIELLSPGA